MIKVEYTMDGGKKWKAWAYYHDDQGIRAQQMQGRLHSLYHDEGWTFRIVPVDESDEPALRKLRLMQKQKK